MTSTRSGSPHLQQTGTENYNQRSPLSWPFPLALRSEPEQSKQPAILRGFTFLVWKELLPRSSSLKSHSHVNLKAHWKVCWAWKIFLPVLNFCLYILIYIYIYIFFFWSLNIIIRRIVHVDGGCSSFNQSSSVAIVAPFCKGGNQGWESGLEHSLARDWYCAGLQKILETTE